ncbi:MAG TPA: exosome complex RNA-binding protein Csl4 [Thermoplasmata archaeon]|nr:exosome complex RNA-binding protein Csl4 [Thermoplasmata archaeon]
MSEKETGRLVLPGELIGTAEEFVPGHGTYEDSGRIYAALLGHTRLDPSDRAVRVDAIHAVPTLSENASVFGRVDEIKSAMAIVTVLADASSGRGIPGTPEGTIHISKAKDGYTDTLADEFASGDIVLAKVLQSKPTVKLTTAPSALGVVAARCQVCHAQLERKGKELECPRCGHVERRKLSEGYGQVPTAPTARAGTDGPQF